MCNLNNSNNGLITKIWGESAWIFGHSITFGYPINPTIEQINNYKNYFTLLGDVLPCKYCRESYKKFITTGETELTNDKLKNRETLTKWFYNIHNKVNEKLEIDYGTTYEDVVEKYESFRANCSNNKTNLHIHQNDEKGCIIPLDYKAFSFLKLYEKDAPIISFELIDKIKNIAMKKNLIEYTSFIDLIIILKYDIKEIKKQKCWKHRNKYCQNIIKYMRENGIPSIENNELTLCEIKLLLFLSSNLNKTELFDILK